MRTSDKGEHIKRLTPTMHADGRRRERESRKRASHWPWRSRQAGFEVDRIQDRWVAVGRGLTWEGETSQGPKNDVTQGNGQVLSASCFQMSYLQSPGFRGF